MADRAVPVSPGSEVNPDGPALDDMEDGAVEDLAGMEDGSMPAPDDFKAPLSSNPSVVLRGGKVAMMSQRIDRNTSDADRDHRATKRWNTLDMLVLRCISMYLGAIITATVLQMPLVDKQIWLRVTGSLALLLIPGLVLYVQSYWPPSSVIFPLLDESTIEFRLIDHSVVVMYKDGDLLFRDVICLEVHPMRGQIMVTEAAHLTKQAETQAFDLDLGNWPGAEIGHALKMLHVVSCAESASFFDDCRLLTAKVLVQVLCWCLRDSIAADWFHDWGLTLIADFSFAVGFFGIFLASTFTRNIMRMPAYTSYHHAPFMSHKVVMHEGLTQMAYGYFQIYLSTMPLSVGWCWNQVFMFVRVRMLEHSKIEYRDANSPDFKGSLLLSSYAVYFLVVTIVTTFMMVYSKRILKFAMRRKAVKKLLKKVNQCWVQRCCCARRRPARSGLAQQDSCCSSASSMTPMTPQLYSSEALKLPHPHSSEVAIHVLPPATELPKDTDPTVAALVEEVYRLRSRVRRLEKSQGLDGLGKRMHAWEVHNDISQLAEEGQWQVALTVSLCEVWIKTVQFIFAWATLDLIDHLFYSYAMECRRTPSDPWPNECSPSHTLGLSLMLSVSSFMYLYSISGLGVVPPMVAALFELQMQAMPLVVGWSWKNYGDLVLKKLTEEWGQAWVAMGMLISSLVLIDFGAISFHIYSVVSRDCRMQYSPLRAHAHA